MNGVNAHEQGNAQPGFGSQHLQLMRFFTGEHVQKRAHLAIADPLRQFGISQVFVRSIDVLVRRTLIRRHVAGTHILAHLADFLFQRHLLQKECSPFFGGQGNIVPVLGRAGGEAKESGKQKDFFHYNCTVRVSSSWMEVFPAFTLSVASSHAQSLIGLPFRLTFLGWAVQRSSKL